MDDVSESLLELLQGASIVFVGIVASRVMALAGQLLMARSLSPDEFGVVALAFTIASVLSGIIVVGTPQGVTRFISATDDTGRIVGLVQSGLLIATVGGVVSATALFFLRFRIQSLAETAELAPVLVLFCLYVVVAPLGKVFVGILRGFKRPTARVLTKDVLGKVSGLALLGVFFLLNRPFTGAIAFWLVTPFVVLAGTAYAVAGSLSLRDLVTTRPDSDVFRELVSFSWPLALSGTLVLLMSQLDVLLIGYLMQVDDVGLYRAVQPLKNLILFSLTAFVFLYLPVATEYSEAENYDQLNVLYRVSTKWLVTATFPLVVVNVAFSSDVVRVLLTEKYVPASMAFAILVAGMFTRVLVGPNGATVQAIDRPRVEAVAAGTGVTANLLLNIALIPRYGIEGAAVATSLGFVVYNLIEIWAIHRETGIVPISTNVVKPLFPTSALALATVIIFEGQALGLISLALLTIVFCVAQILSLFLTFSISDSDITVIERFGDQLGVDVSPVTRRIG